MIETVMIFALGFLLASLCALVLVPILNRRALRLARRRIEGLFPMSLKEIVAERDALRAEFAVAQRRMERGVERARAGRHADMAALGTREMEVAALKRDVETRDASLAERRSEIEAARVRIDALDADLARLNGEHTAGLAALTALEDAHRDILADLKTVRRERDGARHDIQEVIASEDGAEALARSRELKAKAGEAAKAGSALRLLRAEHDAVLADRDALRARLRAAEAAPGEAGTDPGEAGVESRPPYGGERGRDEQDLRARIAEVADALIRQAPADPLGRST